MYAKREHPVARWSLASGLLAVVATVGLADTLSVDWCTVDNGGVTWMAGGNYVLGGTTGQPDPTATMMTGETFELSGGFWTAPPCWCLSDINNDGLRDGRDAQGFVDCMRFGGDRCACADRFVDGILDAQDIPEFVDDLLSGSTCP